jgi:ubiquinone/menaquinone biosynthesis C-methylase UbiE
VKNERKIYMHPVKKNVFVFVTITLSALCLFLQADVRDNDHQPDKVMDTVGVKPGMTIGEVCAGRGYFTFHLSRRVGDTGKIYANDIAGGALASIRRKCEEEGIANIETIVGEVEDPLFPEARLDMVFIVNAFHDLAKPVELLNNIVPGLKPGALVVIIDRDPAKVGGFNRHVLTQEEVLEHIENSDFDLDRIVTFLPQHNIYIIKVGKRGNDAGENTWRQ